MLPGAPRAGCGTARPKDGRLITHSDLGSARLECMLLDQMPEDCGRHLEHVRPVTICRSRVWCAAPGATGPGGGTTCSLSGRLIARRVLR